MARKHDGSVLIVALIIALLLGVVLSGYLLLIRAQSVSVARSQAWHTALTVAEAGVEEALAQLNPAPFTMNATPGWSSSKDLLGGSYSVSYTPSSPPVIYSTGYATVPAISARLTRTIEVKTTNAPLFTVGAAVRGGILMNGEDVITDSFDSTSWYYSTGGDYDPTKRKEGGDIGSAGGILDVGRADIHGRLFLGATSTNAVGPNYSVTGTIQTDFSADFPDVLPPSFPSPGDAPRPGTNGGTAYTYFLTNRNYQTNSLNGSVFVADNANAVLYVTGNATVTNLTIAPGASLKLFVGGPNTTFGQVIVSGTAMNFQYYGLPGNSNITLSGFDALMGTIYAPNATFRAGEKAWAGEMFLDVDFYGALVVNSIQMTSDLKLHFDESLQNAPASLPTRGFVVTSWRELPPP